VSWLPPPTSLPSPAIDALALHAPNLETLRLSDSVLVDDAAVASVILTSKRLRRLDLARCSVTSSLLAALSDIGHTALQRLDIAGCNMVGRPWEPSSAASSVRSSLTSVGTNMYHRPAISSPPYLGNRLPKLEHVNAAGCTGFSAAATAMLVSKAPMLISLQATGTGLSVAEADALAPPMYVARCCCCCCCCYCYFYSCGCDAPQCDCAAPV